MKAKGNHPLAEILAKKLFAIETVPAKEQTEMVNRAIVAAVAWHEEQLTGKANCSHKDFDKKTVMGFSFFICNDCGYQWKA